MAHQPRLVFGRQAFALTTTSPGMAWRYGIVFGVVCISACMGGHAAYRRASLTPRTAHRRDVLKSMHRDIHEKNKDTYNLASANCSDAWTKHDKIVGARRTKIRLRLCPKLGAGGGSRDGGARLDNGVNTTMPNGEAALRCVGGLWPSAGWTGERASAVGLDEGDE